MATLDTTILDSNVERRRQRRCDLIAVFGKYIYYPLNFESQSFAQVA